MDRYFRFRCICVHLVFLIDHTSAFTGFPIRNCYHKNKDTILLKSLHTMDFYSAIFLHSLFYRSYSKRTNPCSHYSDLFRYELNEKIEDLQWFCFWQSKCLCGRWYRNEHNKNTSCGISSGLILFTDIEKNDITKYTLSSTTVAFWHFKHTVHI